MFTDKLEYHFKKASQYGMMAKYYEHKDPEKHIYYYKKHFYHEKKFVHYFKMMESHGCDSTMKYDYESSSMKHKYESMMNNHPMMGNYHMGYDM